MKSLITLLTGILFFTSLQAQLPAYLPTEGLVGWWPFNGNANDESGNERDGSVFGASLSSDRFDNLNSAYSFSGNSFISFPSIPIQGNQSRTFCAWSRLNASPPAGISNYFISSGSSVTSGSFNMRLVNGQLGVMGFGTPGIDVTANTNLNLQENQWYLFSVTYDGDSIRFFLNNQLIDTEDVYPEHNTIGQNNYFGKSNHAGWEYYLNGSLDDIAIYNRALTPAEITALYSGVPAENSGDSSTASTHVPAAIAYQAVARDAQGQPLSTSNVQVRFTLLADSLSGASEYVETHALTTNEFGLFTTAFGSGAPVTSTFAAINWAASNKYLKVELDAGSGFVDMGTQQLLSVPFALRSKSAGEIENDSLPVYPDNAAALAGGLTAGKMYRTATGDLKVVY